MQSSSELFPVALISAELRGDLSEDVYLLKPNNSPDSSVELALTRIGRAGAEGERGVPVVLLHGSFSNRRFWYSPKAIGLGPYLARAGFDVWIAEMRGHGLSPRNENYRDNHVAQYVRYDLPAIADFIIEQTGQTAHWIGHSLGGVILAAALGGGYLDEARARSVALFGSQISRIYWPLKLPPVEWGGRLLLRAFAGGHADHQIAAAKRQRARHVRGQQQRPGRDAPVTQPGRLLEGADCHGDGLALRLQCPGQRQPQPACTHYSRLILMFGRHRQNLGKKKRPSYDDRRK